jgi:acyl-CoA dehydrogenase
VDTAESIAAEFDPEYWYEKEDAEEYGMEFWDALVDAGLHGAIVPEEYGGAGMGMQEMSLAIETLVAEGAGTARSLYLLLTGTMAATALLEHATEAQKEALPPPPAAGDLEFCMGITEPGAGTNTLNVDTFAERESDEFVVNGQKTRITWSDRADRMLLCHPDQRARPRHAQPWHYAVRCGATRPSGGGGSHPKPRDELFALL